MKKFLNFTDWLLLGIGGIIDFIEEIKDPFDLIKNYYQNFYGDIPDRWRKHNFYKLYWRQIKTGNIKKVVQNGEVFLELTSSGWQKIKRKFPFINFQKKAWDGKWRLVIFDIEETSRWRRDYFRQKLKELGFGRLQKSVWITPYNFLGELQEYLSYHRLTHKVILIETKNFFIEDIKSLAAKIWPLAEINHYYKKIYREIILLKKIKNKQKKKQQLLKIRQKIIMTFLHDPCLPDEMLPEDWWADKLKALLKKQKIFTG